MAILLPSDCLCPSLIILVYPPLLSLYLWAISSINFLDKTGVRFLSNDLREAKFPIFALVIIFSAKIETSLARDSLILIFSFKKSSLISDLKRALLWSLSLENFLLLFLFRMRFSGFSFYSFLFFRNLRNNYFLRSECFGHKGKMINQYFG